MTAARRILVIDDNQQIHTDFRKILEPHDPGISDAEADFFGDESAGEASPRFHVDAASQGAEGIELARHAIDHREPYSVAFVDVRMPPGIDGIETAEELWNLCPDLQVVICSAYSDYSWQDMVSRLGHRDRLLVLKKPFASLEALQLACALSEKWELARQTRAQLEQTERAVEERTRELRDSEQRFRQIAEHIDGIFWMTTPDLRETLYLSPGCERILGRSAAELQSAPGLWFRHVHPDDDAAVATFSANIARGEPSECEMRVEHRDGTVRWLHSRSFPVRDESGAVVRVCGIAEDITARHEALKERKLIEVQLRHAQKMEAIGQLAAGIAHEINTPTQYIGDNTRFVQDSFKDLLALLAAYDRLTDAARRNDITPELLADVDDCAATADVEFLTGEIPKAIEQSLQGVQRVSRIVGAMKEFSHPGSEEKTAIDLNHAIESTITVASNEWKYVAEVKTDFDPHLPAVPCLPGEFNQVILNMVVNAAHAIGDVNKGGANGKGVIGVSTRQDGDWVEVRVSDSGTGIREEIREKIFEPFFTTKGAGKGTGQGLAIAHSVVVDKHAGTIALESELGKGTTFIVRLPLRASRDGKDAS